MSELHHIVGTNLAFYRKRKNMKQKDVVLKIGLDNTALSKIEHGLREPIFDAREVSTVIWGSTSKTRILLALPLYEVSVLEILGGEVKI